MPRSEVLGWCSFSPRCPQQQAWDREGPSRGPGDEQQMLVIAWKGEPGPGFVERLQFAVLNSGQSRFAHLPLLADCPSRHAALPSPRLAGSQRLIGFPYSLLRRGWDLGQKSAFRLDLWCLMRGLMLGQRHPAGPLQPCFVLGELSTSCPSHRGGEQSLVEP